MESNIFKGPELTGIPKTPKKVLPGDKAYLDYKKAFDERNNVPVPKIDLLHSHILVKAVPPEIEHTTQGGLVINKVKLDDYLTEDKLEKMSQNVSDEQEILAVGQFISENASEDKKKKLKPGRYVKIDFRRFKTLRDKHASGIIETFYDIPIFTINGYKYMLIDERDVMWVFDK